jgi:hypothetical protein
MRHWRHNGLSAQGRVRAAIAPTALMSANFHLSGNPTYRTLSLNSNGISLSRLLIASKMAVEFRTQEEVVFIRGYGL